MTGFTLSSWYRIDVLGGPGEKSAIRHAGGALGWYNPDNSSQYYFATVYRRKGSEARHRASLDVTLRTRPKVWHHVVQRVDGQGNHSVWHAAHDSAGHTPHPVAAQVLPEFESVPLVNELGQNPMILGYYEKKGNLGTGAISTDEVALWNRVLSAADIQKLFLLGREGHGVTSQVSLKEFLPPPDTDTLPQLRDFGWTSAWKMAGGQNQNHVTLQMQGGSTTEMAIAAIGPTTIERRFPRVSSGTLKVECRVRPRHVTVEVNSPGASVMKVYLRDSRREGSWTMRWHYPWAWPLIGGNTVPRFYVIDGGGNKRKGLEFTDMLMESRTWYTVAAVLNFQNKTWEFWVDGRQFDSHINLGRSQMKWWKTSAEAVDTLRISSTGWNWIDSIRVYDNGRLSASTDFTAEEGYVPGHSLFSFTPTDDRRQQPSD